jgi:RNA polymerase sigma-70 factor (ECF subfamily)
VPRDEDADDIVQDAYMRVFRSLDKFNFEYGFTTWLFRIVTNLAIDHLRKRRPIGLGGSGADDEYGPRLEQEDENIDQPDDALIRDELARKVRSCIDALAPHFRSAMVLRELDGLPCAEIAEIVGATHVTVRWRLHRGRKLFQDEWERREREIEREQLEIKANNSDSGPVDRGEPT